MCDLTCQVQQCCTKTSEACCSGHPSNYFMLSDLSNHVIMMVGRVGASHSEPRKTFINKCVLLILLSIIVVAELEVPFQADGGMGHCFGLAYE